jgi:hypothetical protein
MEPFARLPLGAAFVFPICLGQLLLHHGIYYKTGPGWYGSRPNERAYPWMDESPYVEAL